MSRLLSPVLAIAVLLGRRRGSRLLMLTLGWTFDLMLHGLVAAAVRVVMRRYQLKVIRTDLAFTDLRSTL